MAKTTAGVLPNHDDDAADGHVAEGGLLLLLPAVMLVLLAPHPPAPAVSMMAVAVSIDHFGRSWRWP